MKKNELEYKSCINNNIQEKNLKVFKDFDVKDFDVINSESRLRGM